MWLWETLWILILYFVILLPSLKFRLWHYQPGPYLLVTSAKDLQFTQEVMKLQSKQTIQYCYKNSRAATNQHKDLEYWRTFKLAKNYKVKQKCKNPENEINSPSIVEQNGTIISFADRFKKSFRMREYLPYNIHLS